MTDLERIAKLGKMIWVVKPDQIRIEEMRAQMNFKRRNEFRNIATELEATKNILLYYAYDIHHIIPLSFGGTNKFSNMCLVRKDIHKLIHFYIEQMNNPMKPKQRGYIWVPFTSKKILEI